MKQCRFETFHVYGEYAAARETGQWAKKHPSLLVVDSEFPVVEVAAIVSLLSIATKGAPHMFLSLAKGQFLVDSPLEALADCYHLLKVKPHEGRTSKKK